MNAQKKPAHRAGNRKIALVLCLIAAFFFASVIVKLLWM
jgi:hypothetical protein